MKNLAGRIQTPAVLLTIGIVTRCLVYSCLGPNNCDPHITIVQYLVKHKTFPNIADNFLAFHPPLYYWIAAPVLAFTGSEKAVQFLSLLFSIGTLIVLYKIIYKTELFAWPRARLYSFMLACFLPEFIMFGLYISNDSLTFLLGSLTILQTCNYVKSPDWKQGALLALVTGLGLLTKSTFLAFLPVLLVFVFFLRFRDHRSLSRAAWAGCAFLMISGVLGSYKYIDNYVRYKNPVINSLDVPLNWSTAQKQSYRGLQSYFDFDILRLVASPSITSQDFATTNPVAETTGSYPLLLYGTFWYEHIQVSNFSGTAHKPYSYIGSAIYLVALVATAAFILGLIKLVRRLPELVRTFDRGKLEDRAAMDLYVAAALFIANAALIIATVMKYHVWSLMQGRYLFPTLAGALAIFATGVELVDSNRYGKIVLKSSMIILMVLFGMYLSSEVGYLFLLKFSPGIKPFVKSL